MDKKYGYMLIVLRFIRKSKMRFSKKSVLHQRNTEGKELFYKVSVYCRKESQERGIISSFGE